jgi:hypothetical protein
MVAGSVFMGFSASAIGISWTFAICAIVCTLAASSLLAANARRRAQMAAGQRVPPV